MWRLILFGLDPGWVEQLDLDEVEEANAALDLYHEEMQRQQRRKGGG